MKITLIAVGTRMPAWVTQGYLEFAKRLPRDCQLNLLEIAAEKRGKNADIPRILQREGEAIVNAIPKHNHVIALAINGKKLDTPMLATQLQHFSDLGQDISLIIGGPEGLADTVLNHAQSHWSLSPLTLPHPLVRILIAEQLYRAWSINHNHPYHR